MVSINGFISPNNLPHRPSSFKAFQNLPKLVRDALSWGLIKRRTGGEDLCESEGLAEFIIDRYDMNQALPIGELIDIMERFLDRSIHIRMIHCYVDHGCNLIAAKLAWHEDY